MLVRMLVSISGTRDGVEWPPAGGLIELPELEGSGMVAAGLCEACAELPLGGIEAADAPAVDVETAAVSTRPRRR